MNGIDLCRRQLIACLGATAIIPCRAFARATSPHLAAELQTKLKGVVLTQSSADYESARKTFSFNPRTDARPFAVARCANESDILHCLEFAERNRMEIAVHGGGHDVLAASTCNGGLVIDTSAMNQIAPKGDTLIVGAGARSAAVNAYLQPRGLAVPLGDVGSVGVAGLTLGGGLGWLLGTRGAACDNLRSARILLANGRMLTVSQAEHPDLFWAIRGGGGNFGVATQFQFETHSVGQVLGGKIAYDGSRSGDFLRFFAEFGETAPDELTTELTITGGDERIILLTVCCQGPRALAERAVGPLLTKFAPIASGLSWRPYDQVNAPDKSIGAIFQQHGPKPDNPRVAAPGVYWLGGTVGRLSDRIIDVIEQQTRLARGGWSFALGHHMHGAVCRVPANATALPRAPGSYCYHFDSWWASADEAAAQMKWVDTAMANIAPYSIPTYINYLSDNAESAVRRAYGDKFARLLQLKRRYDPSNVFHRNRNIR
jgi:FAD/FMN-containing dehydrogenase